MVYLALTPQGLQEILESPETTKMSVWCGADTLSDAEFGKRERGNVTRFTYSLIHADKAAIEGALASIEEHHPGESIWVESAFFAA